MLFFQSAFLEKHFGAESERLRNYYYFHFATRQWGGTALAATCQARSGLRPALLSAKAPAGPLAGGLAVSQAGLTGATSRRLLPSQAPGVCVIRELPCHCSLWDTHKH